MAEYFPERIGGTLDDPKVFYTRLYWFNRHVHLWQVFHGPDGGREQQAFQILEAAPEGVDWGFVEAIVTEARAPKTE